MALSLLSFEGVPSPPSWCFTGYFHPLFSNLEGLTLCSGLLALHKPWVKTQNLILNICSIWILTVKCNEHSFSQHYNFQNQKITMLENIGYITELTAWHFYQGHMSGACVWEGGSCSHFFRLTHSAKFEKVNTPLISQFRGSIPRTGQTRRGWFLVLVRQRCTLCVSLGALMKC